MHTSQKQLANAIVSTLRLPSLFEQVHLIGSLSEDRYDKMSDIDLVLVSHQRSPQENVELATKILRTEYGCLLNDWDGSLIPDKYLISHFLPGYDLMWWVDIGCYPDECYAPISRCDVNEEWNAHLGKLLVMNAKHYLRGTAERLRISELYRKVVGHSAKEMEAIDMFMAVRKRVDAHALSDEFVRKLDCVLDQVANEAALHMPIRSAVDLQR